NVSYNVSLDNGQTWTAQTNLPLGNSNILDYGYISESVWIDGADKVYVSFLQDQFPGSPQAVAKFAFDGVGILTAVPGFPVLVRAASINADSPGPLIGELGGRIWLADTVGGK